MERGGGNEAFDLTRRRGGAEKDAEKKEEGRKDRVSHLRWRCAETAENFEERDVRASLGRTLSRMGRGGGYEAFDLTRRRGGAEEDAEKKEEGRKDRVSRLPWRRAETAETRRPSFARIGRLKPAPPKKSW
jgi:hypothetical protein